MCYTGSLYILSEEKTLDFIIWGNAAPNVNENLQQPHTTQIETFIPKHVQINNTI